MKKNEFLSYGISTLYKFLGKKQVAGGSGGRQWQEAVAGGKVLLVRR